MATVIDPVYFEGAIVNNSSKKTVLPYYVWNFSITTTSTTYIDADTRIFDVRGFMDFNLLVRNTSANAGQVQIWGLESNTFNTTWALTTWAPLSADTAVAANSVVQVPLTNLGSGLAGIAWIAVTCRHPTAAATLQVSGRSIPQTDP